MEIPRRELSTKRAENLLLTNLEQQLRDAETPLRQLCGSLIPVFGIRWGVLVIRRVAAGRLDVILR